MSVSRLTTKYVWPYEEIVAESADDHSVLDRWDRVVAAHPDELALIGDRTMTVREVDALTDGMAAVLAERLAPDAHDGRGAGEVPGGASLPVGIMGGQTAETALGMLALTKAGRVIVVLDDHLPEARLEHIVSLSGLRQVLASDELRELAEHSAPTASADAPSGTEPSHDAVIGLDSLVADGADRATALGDWARDRDHTERDAFAIVFTSGSTGLPKGVVVTHRQMLQSAMQGAIALGFQPGARLGLIMPYSFVAGLSISFGGWLNASALVPFDPRESGVDPLLDWMSANAISVFICTPHLVRGIVSTARPGDERMHTVTLLATAGEAITGVDVSAIREYLPSTAYYVNGFGSSEMGSVAYRVIAPGDPVPDGVIPAGHFLPGKTGYIIREDGTEAEVGEKGELVAASWGMCGGYWGAPDQTAKRAGTAPDGTPTWRQGDLARIEPDGTLMVLGRVDDAVKVRGYLVEPSEIEAAFRKIDDVDDAVVTTIVQEGVQTRLVAYVVGKPGRRLASPADLRRALRGALPEYMVPATIVPMTALPRNERGKVDRKLLPPAPAVEAEMVEGDYDQWELVVGQIWAEVLGLRGVPLDEDFAALGGDSLSAEEMLASVDDRLGVDLRASDLLERPTLRAFAARVRAGSSALPSHPDVVKVSTGTDPAAAPVFCFAGAGALALTFLPLARRLGDHDVYAFQQHGIDRWAIPDWSINRIAKRYLALMRITRPRGPYLLVGHSLGGLIALEIARLLRENGEEVAHVVLLDTYAPHSRTEYAELHFGRLQEQPSRNPVVRAGKAVAHRVFPGGIPYGEVFGRRIRAYGAGVIRYKGQKQFDAFFDQAGIMLRRHRVAPYDGTVTYVVADGNPDLAGWEPLLRGQTSTVRIAAEHSSLLREPHVTELAGAIRAAFSEDAG